MFCVHNKGYGGKDKYMFWFDTYEDAEAAFIDYLEQNKERISKVDTKADEEINAFITNEPKDNTYTDQLLMEVGLKKKNSLLDFNKITSDKEKSKGIKIEKGDTKEAKKYNDVPSDDDVQYWPDNFYEIDIIDVNGIVPIDCFRGKHNKLKMHGHYIFFVDKKKPPVVSNVFKDYIGRISDGVIYKPEVAKQLINDGVLYNFNNKCYKYSVCNETCTMLSNL